MEGEDVTPILKKKHDKSDSSPETSSTKVEGKKLDKKTDSDEPKPRIIMTFRSEKPGAKSSTMKIVSTEEKHEEISPRRSNRTRTAKWDSDDDNETLISPKKDKKTESVSENDEDISHTTQKRSTRRRSKEFDVMASAIARKEKYNETVIPTRPSRRIKPTPKVLANEELRQGLELHNNARLGLADKNPEGGVRTRRSVRARQNVDEVEKKDAVVDEKNQVLKLKHLCELGLKAITPDADSKDSTEEPDLIELDDEAEEVDDDSEVISKLLEADAESSSDSDDDYSCSDGANLNRRQTRRSKRITSSYGIADESRDSSPAMADEQRAPRRYPKRQARWCQLVDDIDDHCLPQKKTRSSAQEDVQSGAELDENGAPADGSEGSEAAEPPEGAAIVATCCCEIPSNVYAAPDQLTDPVFCQAIDTVSSTRVGCSHAARREGGALAALVRAGPRAPYVLACALHTAQLRKHMCCPACGLFCTQGTFYQCSLGHLFHLECGLPYNENKGKPGCPHCGVRSYRWQPANRECRQVTVTMRCSERVYLPEQREQCTQAYLSFSTLNPAHLEHGPIIPEELLPSLPADLDLLHHKKDGALSAEDLCEAITDGVDAEQLISKIAMCAELDSALAQGGSCAHWAARRGNLRALHLLQCAGADLNALDSANRTPLVLAVVALLEKSETKSPMKSKLKNGDKDEDMEVGEPERDSKTDDKDFDACDEDLIKVIRYLIAAGCDVNLPGPDDMTALHISSQHGSLSVTEALVAGGAAIDPRDQGGWTPLVWAAENKHAHLVRYLLAQGADATATDLEGNAAVHWCALAGSAAVLQLILDAAPHAVAALNAHGDTPLHVAARQGHYACVIILLARGSRTDAQNGEGELPADVCEGPCHDAIAVNMLMARHVHTKPRRLLTSDISNGRERLPIPCVNEVDDAPPPEDFTYVTAHVTPRSLPVDTSTNTLQGCACKGEDCSTATCECCVLGVKSWYSRGKLVARFPFHDPPMLFECNQTCGCNAKKCTNNLVTRASATGSVVVRCEVFRSVGGRGWGLRAAAAVPRGSLVATYVGELLELPEADARHRDHYMFALDVKPDLLEQCTEKTALCVDAARYGSAARFINHSCSPNLACVRVFSCTRDLRLPTVALFATTDIRVRDEFTFDYGDKFWSVKSKLMRCECGSVNCRYPTKTKEEVDV